MRTRAVLCASALPLVLAITGCGWWEDYYPQFVSRSPDGHIELRVMRNLPSYAADYRFRVELSSARGVRVIHTEALESAIGLVEIHWAHDSSQMGLLVCNMLSGPVFIGYDIGQDRPLPPSTFRTILKEQIARKYSVLDKEDLISWACSNRGNAAYEDLVSTGSRSK